MMRTDAGGQLATSLLLPFTLILGLTALVGLGCGRSSSPAAPQNAEPAAHSTLFDTGRGTGPYDKMTYYRYTSEIALTPAADITVGSIRPQIWYVNGTAGFMATVADSNGNLLASEAGMVDGSGDVSPAFDDRRMQPSMKLRAGLTYRIQMDTWTTGSVGIYTTGSRTTGIVGGGAFAVDYARSDLSDHLDRGAVACQITQ
jgi:hypothetical protein